MQKLRQSNARSHSPRSIRGKRTLYRPLNLLHALRPDFVKLDIALVRDVDKDRFKATLASKIIEAARALGMRVVAEGIETAAEVRWMRENGADLLQGFHIAHPQAVPATFVSPEVA